MPRSSCPPPPTPHPPHPNPQPNKQLAPRIIAEQRPRFQAARMAYRERKRKLEGVDTGAWAVPPGARAGGRAGAGEPHVAGAPPPMMPRAFRAPSHPSPLLPHTPLPLPLQARAAPRRSSRRGCGRPTSRPSAPTRSASTATPSRRAWRWRTTRRSWRCATSRRWEVGGAGCSAKQQAAAWAGAGLRAYAPLSHLLHPHLVIFTPSRPPPPAPIPRPGVV
jgi:hypothetical protein